MKKLAFFFFNLSTSVLAQDYHHWAEHYGTRATLLGGAATAGLGDNGTVYYNPAAMTSVKDPNLSVSVNAYKMRLIKVKNALGDGIDLKQTQFLTYPNLIAGIVRLNKLPRWTAGYAVITRKTFSSNFDFLHQADYEILASVPGTERYIASYNYYHGVLEYWSGFGLGFRISKGWSIGFSHFGIYKNVSYSNNIDISALPSDSTSTEFANVTSKINFNYWDVKGNFKPAVQYQNEKFRFGMAWTTPTFHIMGRGDVYREFSITGLTSEVNSDIVFLDRREKLKVQTRETGGIAIGVSFRFGSKAWLHFAHESNFAVAYYKIFDAPNPVNTYPTTISDSSVFNQFGQQDFLTVGEKTITIRNFGFGYEVRITDRLDMLVGIRTDFNYLDSSSQYYTFKRLNIESSKWSLSHGSLGFGYITKTNKKWTVGIDYSFVPPTPFYQFVNFTSPQANTLLQGQRLKTATATQLSLKLVVAIEFGVLREHIPDKKAEDGPDPEP